MDDIHRRLRRGFSLIVVALVLTFSTTTFADPELAAQYFQEAAEAYEEGDLRRAADLLERAYAEDPNLVYQYNRVLALMGLEAWDEALRVLNVFGGPMSRDPEGRFQDVDEIRTQIETLKKEAEAQAKDPDPPVTDPDPPVTDPKPGPDPPPPVVEESSSALGWILLGSGALITTGGGLMAAGIFAGATLDRVSCAQEAFPRAPGENDTYLSRLIGDFTGCGYEPGMGDPNAQYEPMREAYEADRQSIKNQRIGAGVLLGVGGALIIGGGVVLFLNSREKKASSFLLTPEVGPEHVGASLRIRF